MAAYLPGSAVTTISDAIVELGRKLQDRNYRFAAVTPATHARTLDRNRSPSRLEDVFGWNAWFPPGMLDAAMFRLLEDAGQLEAVDGRFKSKLRFATVGNLIFAHSAFPTRERDAVFFGPDSYRFISALRHAVPAWDAARPPTLFDIGCGGGAGGIYAARHLLPHGARIVLSDINARALMFAEGNALLNDVPDVKIAMGDLLDGLEGIPDIVIANPPYLVDDDARLYRDGGGDYGTAIALRIVEQSLQRLPPQGRLVLYTGTPLIDGVDMFQAGVAPLLEAHPCRSTYEEIDPDIFGEELERTAYAQTERIAAVLLTVTKE